MKPLEKADTIAGILTGHGLAVDKRFEVEYPEPDGTVTTEIVLIGERVRQFSGRAG